VFENIPLEYFETAIRWLQRQPSVDPERIAIHGTSRGGEGALLVGSYFPEIKAVVSNVGSGYVAAAPWSAAPTPAWTWQGEPLLPFAGMPGLAEEDFAQAEIPVERINGPVLLIGADADGIWPSSVLSQVALDRLRRYDHPWTDQLLRYPGAGHLIGVPYQPVAPSLGSYRGYEFGGNLHSNASANANSWPAVLAMLAFRFGPL
jgi:dienelactone hydrolase